MPKAHCSERVKEIGNEIEALEARKATLESEDEPPSFSRQVLKDLKSNLERDLAQSQPRDVKRLLEAFLDRIEVDSKQFVTALLLRARGSPCVTSADADENRTQ